MRCVAVQQKPTLFIDQSSRFITRTTSSSAQSPDPKVTVPQHKHSLYMTYFFSTFLALNKLSTRFDAQPVLLLDLASRSRALHHCFVALSALHISQPNSTTRDECQKTTRYDAITAYQQSITILRVDLARPNRVPDETTLWTTFFLGIFEVRSSRLFAYFLSQAFPCYSSSSQRRLTRGCSSCLT